MELPDWEGNGEIVKSELLIDTELKHVNADTIDPCPYRDLMHIRSVLKSTSPNYSSPPDTLPTYHPVSGLEIYVLRLAYGHVMGLFTIYNCLVFNCELLPGKEYCLYPLALDLGQNIHY